MSERERKTAALWRLWLLTRDPRALLAWGRSLEGRSPRD
jgi:hypothetical protein